MEPTTLLTKTRGYVVTLFALSTSNRVKSRHGRQLIGPRVRLKDDFRVPMPRRRPKIARIERCRVDLRFTL